MIARAMRHSTALRDNDDTMIAITTTRKKIGNTRFTYTKMQHYVVASITSTCYSVVNLVDSHIDDLCIFSRKTRYI